MPNRMLPRQRLLGARFAFLCLILALLAALPGRASASATQQSMLMDDQELIYSAPSRVVKTLEQLSSLGVDTVKVSLVWTLIAPDSSSHERPDFDAANPGAYPASGWARYDLIDLTAHELGMRVYFMIAPPAPLWALPAHQPNQGPPLGRAPILSDLHQFVEAAGRRYGGAFADPYAADPSSSGSSTSVLGVSVPVTVPGTSSGTQTNSAESSEPTSLPAVDYWSVWNEPNERSWLNPWHRGKELIQPSEYRAMVDTSWNALRAAGNPPSSILIGETANVGVWQPLPFIRALYCVASNYRQLRGSAAAAIGCPTKQSTSQFVAANPGLFHGAGFAHHPYSFDVAPNRPYPDPSWITLDNLGTLEQMLNRIYAAYGQSRSGGVPLYVTEWGYKTNPPNPFAKTSEAQQATWTSEGTYMTWADPYVQGFTQFELVDAEPKLNKKPGSHAYWNTFQTGLELLNGKPKPSYQAFRLPLWVPVPHHSSRVTVWGQLRPADHQTLQYGVLEFEPRGSHTFEQIRELQTASQEGFFVAHIGLGSAGKLRLAWLSPGGAVYYSSTVSIS
jgi:hypothetical protein